MTADESAVDNTSSLQRDMLRATARLSLPEIIRDVDGNPCLSLGPKVPELFVRMEFRHLFLSWQRGGMHALNRALESLQRRDFIKIEVQSLCWPEGTARYRTLNGAEWVIESRWQDKIIPLPDQEPVVSPMDRCWIIAGPSGTWTRLQDFLVKDPFNNGVYSIYGMCLDAEKLPVVGMLDAGWDHVDLSAKDFLDRPSRRQQIPASSAKSSKPKKLKLTKMQESVADALDANRGLPKPKLDREVATGLGMKEAAFSRTKNRTEENQLAVDQWRPWISAPEPRSSRSIDFHKAAPIHSNMSS